MRDHERALACFERDLKLRNRSPVTVSTFLATARRFLSRTAKKIREIEPEHVREYLASRYGTVAVTTQAADLVHLRAFFRALVTEKRLDQDPTDRLKILSPGTPPQPLLSTVTVQAILGTTLSRHYCSRAKIGPALALRNRACLELLYGLGIRASEACQALVVDLQLTEGSFLVRRAKRGECRALPLPPSSIPHLERYVREGRSVLAWLGRDQGRLLVTRRGIPLQRDGLWKVVNRLGRRLKLRAYPHAFRRALATHLIHAGVTVEAVRQLLGHRSLSTTATYLTVDREDLRRTVAVLDS